MTSARRALVFLLLLVAAPVVAPRPSRPLRLINAASAQETAKVWVNTRSGVYHCPGSRYYGNTKLGTFLSEVDARASGNRPAYGQSCDGNLASGAATPRLAGPVEPAPATQPSAGTKVWVNSRSHVYHCPGGQYYGRSCG